MATRERLMPPRSPKRDDPHDLSGLRAAAYYRVSRAKDGDERSTGDEKSTGDQKAEAHRWAEREGVTIVAEHEDVSLSASEFARKKRPGYQRLETLIAAGDVDLVWFWALNRATRKAREYLDLAELCKARGVRWVVGGKVYDLDDDDDTLGLDLHNLMDKQYSRKLSRDVKRGKRSSADDGRPAGKVPYGYDRVWTVDRHGKSVWERDVPRVHDDNGRPVTDSPCYIVREIFERLAGGQPLARVRDHLNDRRIPTPRGAPLWVSSTIRSIATNPVYIAKRIHRLDDHVEPGRTRQTDRVKAILEGVQGGWEPLVDEETFWAVQRILGDPSRRTTRLGPRPRGGPKATGGYLLSGLARCAKCGGTVYCNGGQDRYFCHFNNCASIQRPTLDAYVEGEIVGWLSDPDLAAEITSGDGYSAAAAQALGDAERGRAELAQLYRDAEEGDVSATILTRREKRLLEAVKEAERRVQETGRLAVLGGNVGAQAKAGWEALDVAAKRLIVSTLVKVWLLPSGRNRYGPIQDRVELRLIIPGQDEPPAPQAPDLEAKHRERVEAVAALRRQGVPYRQIAQQLGINPTTVWRDVRAAEGDS
jgi:DNA invertase Pin-like site-specific DNA recombinase